MVCLEYMNDGRKIQSHHIYPEATFDHPDEKFGELKPSEACKARQKLDVLRRLLGREVRLCDPKCHTSSEHGIQDAANHIKQGIIKLAQNPELAQRTANNFDRLGHFEPAAAIHEMHIAFPPAHPDSLKILDSWCFSAGGSVQTTKSRVESAWKAMCAGKTDPFVALRLTGPVNTLGHFELSREILKSVESSGPRFHAQEFKAMLARRQVTITLDPNETKKAVAWSKELYWSEDTAKILNSRALTRSDRKLSVAENALDDIEYLDIHAAGDLATWLQRMKDRQGRLSIYHYANYALGRGLHLAITSQNRPERANKALAWLYKAQFLEVACGLLFLPCWDLRKPLTSIPSALTPQTIIDWLIEKDEKFFNPKELVKIRKRALGTEALRQVYRLLSDTLYDPKHATC